MSTIYRMNRRRATQRQTQARYRRQTRFWARLEDPDVILCLVGTAFVASVCLACLIGFLMPI